MIPKGEMMNFW